MRRRAQPWLGTLVEVAIADALDETAAHDCFRRAFARIADVHRLMSFHAPDSDVTRINRAPAGASLEVDADTWAVLQAALMMNRESDGLFDVACAPALVASGHLPSPAGDAVHHRPGMQVFALGARPNAVHKAAAGWIDLGGIAKGYAVDAAVEELRSCGVRSGCVNAGGDLRAFGEKAWPVAVRNPRQPTSAALQIRICDEALATSGAYFSRRHIDGRDCSALLDGVSGTPLVDDFSVTVRAPDCMTADALTKVVAAGGRASHPLLDRLAASAWVI